VVKRVPEGQVDGLVNVVVKRQNLGSFEFEITAATASGGDVDQFCANALDIIKIKEYRLNKKIGLPFLLMLQSPLKGW
jgi:hypothetical protein